MPNQPRSLSQFGDDDDFNPSPYKAQKIEVDEPVSYGSATRGTYESRTAWKTRDMSQGRPLPYSKRSSGSVYKFDDDSNPSMPRSDKGVGKNEQK
jgi:hypothetical protein